MLDYLKHVLSTNSRTYIWDAPSNNFPMKKLRETHLTRIGTWGIDHKEKILFNITGRAPAPSNCPQVELLTTEYKDLYLTKSRDFELVEEIKIDLFIRNRDDYIMFETEVKTAESLGTMDREDCKMKHFGDDIVKIDPNHFGKRYGEIIFVFDCETKVGKIETRTTCHKDIPIENGKFVNARTKILQNNSPTMDCNIHFPMIVESMEGWISINPDIKSVNEPREMSIERKTVNHEDISEGGLYTDEQLAAWETIIQWQTYKDAITQDLTFGICLNKEDCVSNNQAMPRYDITKLAENMMKEANVLKKLDEWIRKWGSYISLLVIIVWTIKLITIVTMILWTLMQEGIQATAAVVYSSCCYKIMEKNKITRRSRRAKALASQQEFGLESETMM